MGKTIIISAEAIIDFKGDEQFESKIKKMISELLSDNEIIIMSGTNVKLTIAKSLIGDSVRYMSRDEVRSMLKKLTGTEYLSKKYIVVSSKRQDMIVAANYKLLFINPLWVKNKEQQALKYGLPVKKISNLIKVIKIINNQTAWFYRLDLDNKTTVLSLTSANYYGSQHSEEEVEILKGFEEVLKKGGKKYYRVLLFHLMAGIANNEEFKEIQDWAIIPSSGTKLNEEMLSFKEQARYLKNGRRGQDMFIRHTETFKSRGSDDEIRLPCDRHFDTISLDPYYKGKLRDRTVCVLDDYSTNGTMFETIRNILIKENVKKIILVSLGKFYRTYKSYDYVKQNYSITGDVYKAGYSYSLISVEKLRGVYNSRAIEDIENLYEIIYG